MKERERERERENSHLSDKTIIFCDLAMLSLFTFVKSMVTQVWWYVKLALVMV